MTFNPKAPPVYKPTPVPMTAPSPFRPQQANGLIAQLKTPGNSRMEALPAPPVYGPNQGNAPSAQLKPGNPFRVETRSAPPVYRPQQRGIPVAQRKPQPAAKMVAGPGASVQRTTGVDRPSPVFPAIIVPRNSWIIQRMEATAMDTSDDEASEKESKESAGVKVLGALSPAQVKEIIGWGSKEGTFDKFDQLADEIFKMKKGKGKDKSLASSVTGVIGASHYEKDGKVVLFLAQQSGKTTRDMDRINEYLDPMDYRAVAMDDVSGSPLHGEMTIIANMLRIKMPLDQLTRVGVAGKKGCCRLCSGVLSKLGVSYSFTKQSAWEEETWADPWAKAGLANPYLTTKKKF